MKKMKKLSILIGTYNARKSSFFRTLSSIYNQEFNFEIDVLINSNDGISIHDDIQSFLKENKNKNIDLQYYNQKMENYGLYYKFLFDKSQTKYIYFLEDDDLLMQDFIFLNAEGAEKYDYFFGKYIPHNKMSCVDVFKLRKLPYFNISSFNELFKKYSTPESMSEFQLSQLVFKKENIKNFPTDDCTYNDYYLFKNNPGSIKIIEYFLFEQGFDGKNISWEKN